MAFPISLATTLGISFDFFSSGYLDVSVLQVRYTYSIYSIKVDFYLIYFTLKAN